MKTAVIIGGGPAGCQCALWLKMLGHEVIIVEQTDKLGGLQVFSPYQNNWIVGVMNQTGRDVAHHIQQHIEHMEIPVIFNSTISDFKKLPHGFAVQVGKKMIETHYIVIATGVIPRSDYLTEAENVLIGPGEKIFHYQFANKRVAILGGGDNAYENYSVIKSKNPKVCHVYSRTIRARQSMMADVNPDDIFSYPYEIDQDKMTVTHDGKTNEYDVIVVLYGWEANFPKALDQIKNKLIDERGFIATNESCETPVTGIYAVGEVANRMHPCVTTSMADGVVAAKAIQQEIESV